MCLYLILFNQGENMCFEEFKVSILYRENNKGVMLDFYINRILDYI